MKYIKMLVLAVAAGAATVALGSNKKGSNIKNARELKASQAVKLVPEYDYEGDKGERTDDESGVAYYTVKLSKGQAYTIWMTGGSAAELSLNIETDWVYYDKESKEDIEPAADFEIIEIDDGATQVAYLYSDDWDDEDPNKGHYVVYIDGGEPGQTTQLYYTKGIRSFDRVGSADSPKVISFSNKWKTHSGKLIEGEYHLKASLKAGRKYRVRTLQGTKDYPLELNVDDGSGGEEGEESSEWYEDSAFAKVANNDALVVVPDTSGKYEFVVSGDKDSQSFKFLYTAVPTRAAGSHPYIPLEEANNYTVSFQPGRMVNSNNYYDDIIDEHLCRIYLVKGQRWVFDTTGASKDLEMIAYNTKGKIVARNSTIGNGSKDMRVTITADATGIYYVGVHDPALDVDSVPDADVITLTARNTATILPPDQFDPTDDLYTGATILTPYPCMTNLNSVEAISLDIDAARNLGAVSERHRFGANDIYDVFAIPCRAGCTYQLRAAFSDENDTTDLTLGSTVFYYASDANYKAGKGTTASIFGGSVSPSTSVNLNDDLTFTAAVNGTYYVRVWVKTAMNTDGTADNALGLDFPAYDMYATVRNSYVETVIEGGTTNEVERFNGLGLLKGEIEGGVGSWSVAGDARTYPSGSQVVLTNKSVTVSFAAVTGFNAPANVPANVDEWTSGADPVVVTGRYTDIYDTKYIASYITKTTKKNGKKVTTKTPVYSAEGGDNTPEGAFAITPANKAASLQRTLWADDPVDHFKFTAAAGTYYSFAVESASSNVTVAVSNAVTGAVVEGLPMADGTGAEISKQLLDAGLSYLIVSHGDDADKDVCYTLTYSKATSGVVQFAYKYSTKKVKGKTVKTPITVSADDATPLYSVKEGTEYATLSVTRSAAEGAMRVKYATQAVTAQPGTNYYPVTDGEISWAAGDKAAKTLKIRLIPDMVAQWAASNLTFKVHLFPVDEYDLADNECLAQTNALATAVVSIVEATGKKPGTISVKSYADGISAATPVANAKKPVVTGTAGKGSANTLPVAFARTGGANGPVSVKVTTTTAKGNTAKAGVDYVQKSEVLSWADGDAEDKVFTIELPTSEGYTATKNFTLSIAVVKTDGTAPALASKTATVTLKNALVDQTAAEYAKTIAASTKLKLASTGTWFKDYDGALRSGGAAGTLTYTLTGPGFFLCKPSVVTNEETAASLFCQFDKEAAIDCMADGFDGTVARVLAAGTHTVKFTLAGATDDEHVKFENQEDGSPYLWVPLTDVAAYDPMTKSVVQTNQTKLVWTLPAGIAGRVGIYNRVRFGTSAKTMAAVTNVPATVTEIDMPVELAPGAAYYWAVDTAYTAETGLSDEAIDALTYVTGSAWTFSVLKDGAPITDVRTTCVDAQGRNVGDLVDAGEAIELIQGVKPDFELTSDGDDVFRFVGGTLPKGLSLNSAGKLVGAPSTPGEYRALVQSYDNKVPTGKYTTKKVKGKKTKVPVYTTEYGTTVPVNFKVVPAGTSIGSFRAALAEDGSSFEADPRKSGLFTFSSTSAGKLTASVTIGGVAYKFTGTGYDEIIDRDETTNGCTRTFRVQLTNVTKINKKTKTTNYLTLTMRDGAVTNGIALAEAMGSVELLMQVANPKKTAVVKDVTYRGDIYRNNGTTDLGKEAMANFNGYYTVSLPPEAVTAADGVPVGNGYLLMTVAESSVKVTGVLADGTAVSCSTFGQLIGEDLADARKCALYVPVFAGKTTVYSIAGVVKIAFDDPAADGSLPVVAPSAKLVWAKPAAAANTREGVGFALSLAPTGGWYDKVVNLQAYYLNRDLAVYGAESGDDLPAEALAKGYSFADQSTPQDLAVKFTGNAFSVAARKFVKNKTTGMYDFTSSSNPWAVTFKFTRATGVVTGTMSAWEWVLKQDAAGYTYATGQKEIKKLAHKGVLLFSRDASSESPLAADTLTSGFFLMPATKKWKASLPFTIRTTDDSETVWNELDFGADDGDGGE